MTSNNWSIIQTFIFILAFTYILFQSPIVDSNPIINEIMINPLENDNTHEWIEIYNPTNKSINMSQWTITDNFQTDTLEPYMIIGNNSMILPSNQYCIITDKGTELYNNTTIPSNILLLTVDDLSIGNGLGNLNDMIILKNQTGYHVDSVEWGEDYPEIPGEPIPSIQEAMSIIRTTFIDTNNSINDFKETHTPTPGDTNIYTSKGNISITMAPSFIPKAYTSDSYSLPFSIQIQLQNFSSSNFYEMKVAIQADNSTHSIASQTWDLNQWQYSDRYLFNITPNETGSYSQWVHLRFNTNYKTYKEYITHQQTAFFHIKIREKTITTEFNKEVNLLDMDTSTKNAIPGGYYVTTLTENELSPPQNQRLLLSNKNSEILSIYSSENNSINEGLSSTDGFVKLSCPTGSNYTLYFLNENNQKIMIKDNITISQGQYNTRIKTETSSFETKPQKSITIPLTIENTGDFNDTYTVKIEDISHGWHAKPSIKTIQITSKHHENISIKVTQSSIQRNEFSHGTLLLFIQSQKDLDSQDLHSFSFEIIAPDLTIPNIKTYDSNWNEIDTIGQGRNLKIKAYCKNTGNKNASNVYVSFFCDTIDDNHYIGSKTYEDIGKYQKYPSILLDTSRLSLGKHTIYVIVDHEENIKELDEYNNENQIEFTITNTSPTKIEKQLLISEFYYHNYPGIANEYLSIYNPSNISINLTGFYLTNTPFKNYEDQCIIQFPNNSFIKAFSHLYITQKAGSFYNQTGFQADFEYKENTNENIVQMIGSTSFTMGNTGDAVALKNSFNHSIDFICYGNISFHNHTHWNQSSIPLGSPGQLYKRMQENNFYIDTNTMEDFNHSRIFFIGQTDLKPFSFQGNYPLSLFVSPDSSYQAISDVLKKADFSIQINMYEFTNMHLCNQLINCLQRNVSITILMEGSPVGGISDEGYYILNRLSEYGADIYFIKQDIRRDRYSRYSFNHAKYAIIDNETLIIESCNWAETGVPVHPSFGNREWGIIIHNQSIARYLSNIFYLDCNQSRPDIIPFHNLNHTIPADFYMGASTIYGKYEHPFLTKYLNSTATITPVFSPDTSLHLIESMILQAQHSIYIQQLYIYPEWEGKMNPLIQELITKAQQGLDIKVIFNYNPYYKSTIIRCNETKQLFEKYGIQTQFIYTNSSPFSNIHNKGMIIDNNTVLISSINWNENSIMKNREVGVIIESTDVASYYADVFFYDWHIYDLAENQNQNFTIDQGTMMPDNMIYIVSVFMLTFIVIARDWKQRKWD